MCTSIYVSYWVITHGQLKVISYCDSNQYFHPLLLYFSRMGLLKILLFACILLQCYGKVNAQRSEGDCPPNESFGVCVFDPNACTTDAVCDSGEKCCPMGCNRYCKEVQTNNAFGGLSKDKLYTIMIIVLCILLALVIIGLVLCCCSYFKGGRRANNKHQHIIIPATAGHTGCPGHTGYPGSHITTISMWYGPN